METFLAEVFVDAHRLVGGNCELMHEYTWELQNSGQHFTHLNSKLQNRVISTV